MKLALNKETALLVSKVLIFLYIITSPFIDHVKYLSIFNTITFKILILILIVITSFIDIQLAILLTIAFFVMIINFNKSQISKLFVNQPQVETQSQPQLQAQLQPQSQPIISSLHNNIEEEQSKVTLSPALLKTDVGGHIPTLRSSIDTSLSVVPYTGETLYDFPDATCNTKPFEDTGISKDLIGHYIDPKVKPYEVYIRMLTNGDNLEKAQSNLI